MREQFNTIPMAKQGGGIIMLRGCFSIQEKLIGRRTELGLAWKKIY